MSRSYFPRDALYDVDFNEVKGQEHVKRALEIAAAGGHNVLMVGPPGSGKTMLAQRLATILPDLTFEEALETTKVYSIMGLMGERAVISTRPFRSPHHTISDAGLIGGGQIPKPGEVSLAHNGVLFLDEMPEFRKNVLEVLRQPMEDGKVTIARAATSITYPASFMASCCYESMSVRLLRRLQAAVPVHSLADPAVSDQDFRTAAGSVGHSCGSSGRAVPGSGSGKQRGILPNHKAADKCSQNGAAGAVHAPQDLLQCPDAAPAAQAVL